MRQRFGGGRGLRVLDECIALSVIITRTVHCDVHTSYTMVSSGILWNISRVTCIFQYRHKPLGKCVYKENTIDEWDIHSMPLETIV